MADGGVCKTTKKPEYIAWRQFRNGNLEEASYISNGAGAVLQIFKPNEDGTINYTSFFEGHGGADPDPPGERKNLRNLSRLERDLIRLPEKDFKKKYPNVELFETILKARNVGERIIED